MRSSLQLFLGVVDSLTLFVLLVPRSIVSSPSLQIGIEFSLIVLSLSGSSVFFAICLFTIDVEYLEGWDARLSRYCSVNLLSVGHPVDIAFAIVSKSPLLRWPACLLVFL